MSEQQAQAVLPVAGWYPHPADATQLRWWDGAGWTDQFTPTAESRRSGTVWVWFLAVSPLLSLATGLGAIDRFITVDIPAWHWLALLVVPYVLIVGAAVLDAHKLRTWHRETAPWAWAFLGALPYLIARTVVLRRRGKFGSAPLWVALGCVLVGVLALVAMGALFLFIIQQLSNATY